MTTGWNNGLCQDYDRGLGRWFADRLGAREQLRKDCEMKHHITQEQVCTLWIESTSRTTDSFALYTELCNAAIQHYIDQQAKELPVLPEPLGRTMRFVGRDAYARKHSYCARTYDELPKGMYSDTWQDLEQIFTSDQLQAYGQQCAAHAREVALEEAANICNEICDDPHIVLHVCTVCAENIRVLKKAGK